VRGGNLRVRAVLLGHTTRLTPGFGLSVRLHR
jgi:hypothetical protein